MKRRGATKSRINNANCIGREIQDRIVRVTPNSDRAKEILAELQKKGLRFTPYDTTEKE